MSLAATPLALRVARAAFIRSRFRRSASAPVGASTVTPICSTAMSGATSTSPVADRDSSVGASAAIAAGPAEAAPPIRASDRTPTATGAPRKEITGPDRPGSDDVIEDFLPPAAAHRGLAQRYTVTQS